jgi:hypothetical protein
MTDEELRLELQKLNAQDAVFQEAIERLQEPRDLSAGYDMGDLQQVMQYLEQKPVDSEAVQRARYHLAQNANARDKINEQMRQRHRRAGTLAAVADLQSRREVLEAAVLAIEEHIELTNKKYATRSLINPQVLTEIRAAYQYVDKASGHAVQVLRAKVKK